MNTKMTTNSQLSTTEPKQQNQTKQITRTGTESQKWRSRGGLSEGSGTGENGEKVTGNKKHRWQVQNRQGEVKNSIGNGEVKELTCMIHRHELRGGREGYMAEGDKGEKKWDNYNSVINKIYLKRKGNEKLN